MRAACTMGHKRWRDRRDTRAAAQRHREFEFAAQHAERGGDAGPARPPRGPTAPAARRAPRGTERERLDHVGSAAHAAVEQDLGTASGDRIDDPRQARRLSPGEASSWRPPWFDTTMPAAPAATARRVVGAHDALHEHRQLRQRRSQPIASQSAPDRAARRSTRRARTRRPARHPAVAPAACRFSTAEPGGSANRLRTSRSRRPSSGASTVSTSARHPAASTRRTSASVACRDPCT